MAADKSTPPNDEIVAVPDEAHWYFFVGSKPTSFKDFKSAFRPFCHRVPAAAPF
jgi:hypothetical protein